MQSYVVTIKHTSKLITSIYAMKLGHGKLLQLIDIQNTNTKWPQITMASIKFEWAGLFCVVGIAILQHKAMYI